MALKGTKKDKDSATQGSLVDRSHELRHQELHPSRTVTAAGETSHEGDLELSDLADEYSVDGNDNAALGMEDIGGTDTEMMEERARDIER